MKDKTLAELLEVFLTVQVSKELPRQGFIYSGFKLNETDSVAAHSFSVTLFSYMLSVELKKDGWDVDPDRVMKIALFHDVGETITGDIGTYAKELARDRFDKVEKQAFALLMRNFSDKKELQKYFKEYQTLSSKEAQIVKFVDTLDAFVQGFNTPSADQEDVRNTVRVIAKRKIKNKRLHALFRTAVQLISDKKVGVYKGHIGGNGERQKTL